VLSPDHSAAAKVPRQAARRRSNAAEAGFEGWRRKAGKGLSRPEKAWSQRETRTAPNRGA